MRPDAPNLLYDLACARVGTGDLDGAAREATLALEKEPENPISPLGHFVLADVWNRQGRPQEAAREARLGKELEARIAQKKREGA